MQAHAGNAARMLKALANESRLMILCLLVEQERSVSELNALLPLSQSALSQHLSVLREDGLVTTRRQAQAIIYGIAESPAREIIGTLHDVYCGKGAELRRLEGRRGGTGRRRPGKGGRGERI